MEEISDKWPNEDESVDNWRDRCKNSSNLENCEHFKERISDKDDEEEILDKYIDQSYEDALIRSGEALPEKIEIITYLERIALYHNQHRKQQSYQSLNCGNETRNQLKNFIKVFCLG